MRIGIIGSGDSTTSSRSRKARDGASSPAWTDPYCGGFAA
jgi:hypothetical protein